MAKSGYGRDYIARQCHPISTLKASTLGFGVYEQEHCGGCRSPLLPYWRRRDTIPRILGSLSAAKQAGRQAPSPPYLTVHNAPTQSDFNHRLEHIERYQGMIEIRNMLVSTTGFIGDPSS